MSQHGYESGRLNLPFVGICTFGKWPYQSDWSAIDADVAVLGAPFDFGTQWRAGARQGPRGVREASTLFAFGHAGAYDHEDDITYLPAGKFKLVDLGDADIVHTDTLQSHANIEAGVRAILEAGALPVVIGGDHSINIPCINAFDGAGDIHVVQIDAHSTSSTSAMACATAMATRCGVRPRNPTSPASARSAFATSRRPRARATRMPAAWARISSPCASSASSASTACWHAFRPPGATI